MPRSPVKKNIIPERYTVRDTPDGKVVSCLESPNLSVFVQQGKVWPGPQARKAAERTIFLDGAASGEPFMDPERHVYNMDHHEGCVRSFTLSTCEQAAVIVMRGLSLSEKTWQIRANDPDLDTILAIWVLLNHNRLVGENDRILQRIMPLLRLEGIIDAHGLEIQKLAGFPEELHQETIRKIEYLRETEITIKKAGQWETTDFAEYTLDLLGRIDELVYHPSTFRDFKGLEELAREELANLTSAVVYRTDLGIYEVEELLKRIYKNKPGLVIVEKNEHIYTIRKTDLFIPIDLDDIYERLNRIDRNVNGTDPENRWGGSSEIGGSPRKTGTALTPGEIAAACKFAYKKPGKIELSVKIFWNFFLGLLIPFFSWALLSILDMFGPERNLFRRPFLLLGSVAILYTIQIYLVFNREANVRPWFYGVKKPVGRDWWLLLPGMLIGAALGGFVSPFTIISDEFSLGSILAGWILLPLSIELLYRGLIHGDLSNVFKIQISGDRWFLSKPALISGLIYTAGMFLLPTETAVPVFSFMEWDPQISLLVKGGGSFITGTVLALVRERSDSIVTTIGFHSAFAFALSIFTWYSL